nr:uncharacterized protein LOC109163961 [Ipomoea batatas]
MTYFILRKGRWEIERARSELDRLPGRRSPSSRSRISNRQTRLLLLRRAEVQALSQSWSSSAGVAGTKGERRIPHPIFSTTPALPINTTQTSQTQNATPVTSQSHNPTQSHPSSTHSSPSHHQLATNISSSSRQQNTTSLASGQTLPIDNTQGEVCSSFADLDQPPVYEMSAEGQLTPTSPSNTQNLPTSSAHIEPASSIPSGTSGSVHTSDSLPPSARHTETTQTQPPRRSMRGLSLLLVEIEPGLSPNFSPQRELTSTLATPLG